jgi:hypothetical protein
MAVVSKCTHNQLVNASAGGVRKPQAGLRGWWDKGRAEACRWCEHAPSDVR